MLAISWRHPYLFTCTTLPKKRAVSDWPMSPGHNHWQRCAPPRHLGKDRRNDLYNPDYCGLGATPPFSKAPLISEQYISSLPLNPIPALGSFEFLLEPFPKPYLIKPYCKHHHYKYQTSTKVHGYTSFPVLIYDPT